MTVQAAKDRLEKRGEIYLDAEMDFRDPKNLAVVITQAGAASLKTRASTDPAEQFRGKKIRATRRRLRKWSSVPRIEIDDAKQIRLADEATSAKPTVRHILEGHTKAITCLAFSRDGRRLASGSKDEPVRLWDMKSLKTLAILPRPHRHGGERAIQPGRPNPGHRQPRPRRQAVGHVERQSQTLVARPTGRNPRRCLRAPTGATLGLRHDDHSVKIWDFEDRPRTRHPGRPQGRDQIGVEVSADGKTLASTGWDRTVRLWDFPEGKVRHVLEGHPQMIRVARIQPHGNLLASATGRRHLRLEHRRQIGGEARRPSRFGPHPLGSIRAARSWLPAAATARFDSGHEIVQNCRPRPPTTSCRSRFWNMPPTAKPWPPAAPDNKVRLWDVSKIGR